MGTFLFGMDYWRGKKINCLGDSITYGDQNGGISWVDMIGDMIPFGTIRKYGVCGSTVCVFPERDDSLVERFRNMDMDYDLTIIFGGINDFNHSLPLGTMGDCGEDTFYGALRVMVTELLRRQPKGRLMFITPMKGKGFKTYPHWPEKNEAGYCLKDYRAAIFETAEYFSIPVLDLFSMSGITPDIDEAKACWQADGLHPTAAGYEQIARRVAGFILGL